MTENQIHEHYMRRAIELAREAAALGEVPVGAVLAERAGFEPAAEDLGPLIIAEGYNLRESNLSPTAHAEILALEKGSRIKGAWRLTGTTLYVTLEPCLMCSGALLSARVDRVVYGALDPKAGAVHSLYKTLEDPRLNHRCEVIGGVLEQECGALLTEFFRSLRQKKS